MGEDIRMAYNVADLTEELANIAYLVENLIIVGHLCFQSSGNIFKSRLQITTINSRSNEKKVTTAYCGQPFNEKFKDTTKVIRQYLGQLKSEPACQFLQ